MASLSDESKLSTFILPPACYPRLKFLRNKFEPLWKRFITSHFTRHNEKIPERLRSIFNLPRVFVISSSDEETIPLHSLVQDKNVVNENQERETNSISDFDEVTSEEIMEGIPHAFIVMLNFDVDEGEDTLLQQTQKVKIFLRNLETILRKRFLRNSLFVIRTQGCKDKHSHRCNILSWVQESLSEEDEDFNLQLKYKLFLSYEDGLAQRISRILENNMKERVQDFIKDMKSGTQDILTDLDDDITTKLDEMLDTKREQLDTSEDWLSLLDFSRDAKEILVNLSSRRDRRDLLRHYLSRTERLLLEDKSSKLYSMSSKHNAISVHIDGQVRSKEIALKYLSTITQDEFESSIRELRNHVNTQVQAFRNDVVQVEQCIERLLNRLSEEIPHEFQVIMGRTQSVMMIKKKKTSIEIYLRGDNTNETKDEIRMSVQDLIHDNLEINFHSFQGNKVIKRFIGNGDQIGHYNSIAAKYGFGTTAMIAIADGFNEKFAFTCEHVAPAQHCVYGTERYKIGFANKNHCIQTDEEYLGCMLDFSAVHLGSDVDADLGVKDQDGGYYTPRLYDGSLNDLEDKELFFYGSTSMSPKKVRYTHEAIFREEEEVADSENDLAGKDNIRRILLLRGQPGEVIIPGDSGSLVCYKDNEACCLYAVFILIGGDSESEDLACCRLSDCLDCLEDRGVTFLFEEQKD